MNTEQSARKTYLDVLRAVAAIFVITIHVVEEGAPSFSGADRTAILALVTFVRPAVALFVMISGALWLDPKKNVPPRRVGGAVLRLVCAFVVWSAFYALVVTYALEGQGVKNAVYALLRGQTHMWFLFMMTCLYLLIPFFRRIASDRRLVGYFLIISLVFTFAFPAAIELFDLYTSGTLNYVYSKTYFHFTLGYAPYFFLGWFIASGKFKRGTRIAVYVLGVAAFAASVILTLSRVDPDNYFKSMNLSALRPFILFQSAALFMFAKHAFSKLAANGRAAKAFAAISPRMFGVYLVHWLFVKLVFRLPYVASALEYPLLFVPLAAAAIFAASLAVSAILGRIPVVKKYIV